MSADSGVDLSPGLHNRPRSVNDCQVRFEETLTRCDLGTNTHTQSPHSRLTSEGLDPPGFDANQLRGMSDVDGFSAEWPNKNARVNARHAVTPLEGMPVIWRVRG